MLRHHRFVHAAIASVRSVKKISSLPPEALFAWAQPPSRARTVVASFRRSSRSGSVPTPWGSKGCGWHPPDPGCLGRIQRTASSNPRGFFALSIGGWLNGGTVSLSCPCNRQRMRASGPARIRTENQGIMSGLTPRSNHLKIADVTSIPDSGRTTGRTDKQNEGGIPDAELSRIVAAWPTLPEPIRKAMLALVAAGG